MDNLLSKIKFYYAEQFNMLTEAYEFAKSVHAGQKRVSGEDYFIHPYSVAETLVDLRLDASTIAAAFLHDVFEDTQVARGTIIEKFGQEVCDLVEGVTKLEKLKFASKEEEQAENLRKMFFAMSNDVRVVLIKLADRLHNMRSLQHLTKERQHEMAKETLDIYAPLAGRLGISQIKCELDDIALKYLDNDAYVYLSRAIAEKMYERKETINKLIGEIKELLAHENIEGEVFGRPKHFYSIYKKMKKYNCAIEEVYDLIAIRILVQNVRDCYALLGTIHAKWKPIPGRIKDYISVPKPNNYQSLHTTVITRYGQPFEIQIRTYDMHQIAEYGVAAHWKYKEGKKASNLDNKLDWLKDIVENESLFKSSEFYNNLKSDLISAEVLVFTPKGDVVSLCSGATPLDFAYQIHSEIGNKCVGAKVNDKIVSLNYTLFTGDRVEILTNKNSRGPSWDWIKIVKSTSARSKIKQFFRREMKEENVALGKEICEREAKKRGYTFSELLSDSVLKILYTKFSVESMNEIYAAIGYGAISYNSVIYKCIEYYKKSNPKTEPTLSVDKRSKNNVGVLINGIDDLLIKIAGCCNPLPGDKIMGFISRGRGVSVHRANCPNFINSEDSRKITAEWAQSPLSLFNMSIRIVAEDTESLISNITGILASLKLNITSFNARIDKKRKAVIDLSVQIPKIESYDILVKKLLEYKSIKEVYRTTS